MPLRFLTNNQPAMPSSGSVSARRYKNTRSSTARLATSSFSCAAALRASSLLRAASAAWLASSAACCCASTATPAARSFAFSASSARVRAISSVSWSGCAVARRVDNQLLKVSLAAAVSACAAARLSLACSRAASAAALASSAALISLFNALLIVLSEKSSTLSLFSTCGKSPTTAEPSPIKNPANTNATSHRPRRIHFSVSLRDLVMLSPKKLTGGKPFGANRRGWCYWLEALRPRSSQPDLTNRA